MKTYYELRSRADGDGYTLLRHGIAIAGGSFQTCISALQNDHASNGAENVPPVSCAEPDDMKEDINQADLVTTQERFEGRSEFRPTVSFLQRRLRWGFVRASKVLPFVLSHLDQQSSTRTVHNPHNLTEWGQDQGYRLLDEDEIVFGPDIEGLECLEDDGVWCDEYGGCSTPNTYRTKLTRKELAEKRGLTQPKNTP